MNNLRRVPLIAALIAALLLALAPLAASAQEAAPNTAIQASADAVSLDDALRSSAKRSPDIQSAAIELRRARLSVSREQARFTTNLTGDVGFTRGSTPALGRNGEVAVLERNTLTTSVGAERTFTPGTRASATFDLSRTVRDDIVLGTLGPGYSLGLSLAVTQPLLRGFGADVTEANLRLAQQDSLTRIIAQERAASAALRDVVNAYWELWYAQRAHQLRIQGLQIARDSLAIGQLQVDAGAAGEDTLLPLLTEVASVEEEVLMGELEVEQRALALSALTTGQPVPTLRAAEAGPQLADVSAREQAVASAAERSLALRELRAAIKTARLQADIARNNERIQLDASGSFQLNGLSNTSFTQALALFGSFQATQAFIGLSVALPVDNRALEDETSRAELAVRSAELRYQTEQERLAQDITLRIATLERSSTRLQLARRTADLSGKSVAAEQVRYQAGESTALDVVRQIQQQRQAELRILRLQADMAIAQAALDDASGGLVMRHADLIEQP